MGALPQSSHPDLLVEVGDDAAVWSQADGKVLISTADFFGPLVDDPFLWGQIAAANAASDIYAMGGKPLFALNLVCWPGNDLSLDVLQQVLSGGAETAERGGWNVVGGHTVTGPEPLYGQAVTGEAHADSLLTLSGGQAGQALILTKPLGTGIITTAAMRRPKSDSEPGGDLHEPYQAAIAEMLRLNDIASQVASQAGATAATDITGFGLLGHLRKLCEASGVGAEIDVASIPLLPEVAQLAAQGYAPGGATRNLDYVKDILDISSLNLDTTNSDPPDLNPDTTNPDTAAQNPTNSPPEILTLLADPQTSGGLLFACPQESAQEALTTLTTATSPNHSATHPQNPKHTATQIGTLTPAPPTIHLH